MAKSTRSKTTKKRQPAKSQLPPSRVKKSSLKATKKKTSANKRPKSAAKSLQRTAVKSSSSRKPTTRTKKLSLRISRRTSLVLTFKLAKKAPAKKKKSVRKAKRELTIEKNLLLSFAMVVVGVFGVTQSGEHIFSAPLDNEANLSHTAANDSGASKKYLTESIPTRLSIPAINLETPLTTVGKNSDGTMEVPADHHKAGWYRFGPTPGEIGPAVITGHVNSYKGPSVFANLSKLKKGQIIKIKREDGKVAKFKVTDIRQFPQNSFPTQEVYGNIKHAGLRLITCGGSFNFLTRQYSDNTVVFASYIE